MINVKPETIPKLNTIIFSYKIHCVAQFVSLHTEYFATNHYDVQRIWSTPFPISPSFKQLSMPCSLLTPRPRPEHDIRGSLEKWQDRAKVHSVRQQKSLLLVCYLSQLRKSPQGELSEFLKMDTEQLFSILVSLSTLLESSLSAAL